MLAMVQRRPRRYPTRLYLFEGGQPTARIPVSVFKQMLAGVSFKRFAGTSQSILEITFDPAGVPKKIAGSIYRFDDNGLLDLGAIAGGVEKLIQERVQTRGSVSDISGVLGARRWRNENLWTPTAEAVSQVITDIDDQGRGK